jgi:hypothetical protein
MTDEEFLNHLESMLKLHRNTRYKNKLWLDTKVMLGKYGFKLTKYQTIPYTRAKLAKAGRDTIAKHRKYAEG